MRAAIHAALGQSAWDFELIVVDDGSTDDGALQVQSIADSRLRVISQQNAGVSAARNAGILAARGEWIALLDADDLWERNHLEGLARETGGADTIAVFSNQHRQSLSGRLAIGADTPVGRIDNYFAFALSHGGYPLGTSAIMIRRRALIAEGLFAVGEPMGEDIDMWCRLCCRGPFIYNGLASSTYNDAPAPDSVARNLNVKAFFPPFAKSLPAMIDRGDVPTHLRQSAKRYANFLMLEYARQLLDRGRRLEARRVLIRHCSALLDPLRFAKRLARTWPVGQTLFRALRNGAA